MKMGSYLINSPMEGVCKQWCILAQEQNKAYSSPLVYLQRPKWITNDDDWERVVKSLHLSLPKDMEVS